MTEFERSYASEYERLREEQMAGTHTKPLRRTKWMSNVVKLFPGKRKVIPYNGN